MNKIGVFGGTFNPVHRGHEITALEFYDKFCLDRLLVIPSGIPPHKQDDTKVSPYARLEMCELCFGKYKNRNIQVSDIEIKKEGVSYTFDTLSELVKIYPKDHIYFLAGSDMFLSIECWHRYEELLSMCVFAAAFRQNGTAEKNEAETLRKNLTERGYRIEFLENAAFEISSTKLREKMRSGDFEGAGKYISPEVLNYIKERKIYVLQ
ncbi:MAG: nicotinate-nucleotide adenylyltransferase [Oscillospiraceae bacterium]|nr:nicotinate-nucleotide adenylyltransferase [Oscillospiraceae bacterium]